MRRLRIPLIGALVVAALLGVLSASASDGSTRYDPLPSDASSLRSPALFPTLDSATDYRGLGPDSARLDLRGAKDPRMSSHVVRLAQAERQARARGETINALSLSRLDPDLQAMAKARLMRIDGQGRVQVYVLVATKVDRVVAHIERARGQVERFDETAGIVQALVPIGQLEALAHRPSVRYVRLPDYGFSQAGSVTTEGDSILGADLVRSTFGVDGTGVKVGVISDGVGGLADSQASGDLPTVNTTTCNVAGSDPTLSGAEGTAILEIVHDLAPGAELWFGHFWAEGTSLAFNDAVDCLAANTDVVVDDIAWFNVGPYDGTSSVSANTSAELNQAANPIRAYATSVANMARRHYQEPFLDSGWYWGDLAADFWVLHRFQGTADTDDAGLGLPCHPDFPDVLCGDTLRVAPGGAFIVWLQWNDDFGNSSNDYDLLLLDEFGAGTLYLASTGPQMGAGYDPVEAFAWENTHALTTDFDILIGNYVGGAASRTFDMFVYCDACFSLDGATHNFNTPGSSVPNQSDAGGGVMSVGAINASEPGNDDIASYSSLGPTNDVRTKPDITAIDGVSVTGAGGFPSSFYGTSAASPHIGGIAALLLECNPGLMAGEPGDSPSGDRTALRNALLGSAVDLGSQEGVDNTYGYGRADAEAAAAAAGCSVAFVIGDVDCDDDVDAVDALFILQNVAGLRGISSDCPPPSGSIFDAAADADCDTDVDAVDALFVLQHVAGLRPELCPT